MQHPAQLVVSLKNQGVVLRRAGQGPALHASAVVSEVLASAEARGVISAAQKGVLAQEMSVRLDAML